MTPRCPWPPFLSPGWIVAYFAGARCWTAIAELWRSAIAWMATWSGADHYINQLVDEVIAASMPERNCR